MTLEVKLTVIALESLRAVMDVYNGQFILFFFFQINLKRKKAPFSPSLMNVNNLRLIACQEAIAVPSCWVLSRWANRSLVSSLQGPTFTLVEEQLSTLVWLFLMYFPNVAFVSHFREVKRCVPISHLLLHERISLISFYTKSGKGQQCSYEQASGVKLAGEWMGRRCDNARSRSCSLLQLHDVTGCWDARFKATPPLTPSN